ncbi:uncharacterized protein [Atheta coriaria]|uniref:uncharacterized protein isoform X2 n=1 Tax=Dalotia coriaria TaxID=877792 RepID=UPI0031F34B27
MSVPSMVHRSGDTLVVRSVVSGDALYGTASECGKDDDTFCKPTLRDIADIDAKDLPECKVKRNYSCAICDFFTQNPRSYLYHLRDVHHEKVKIYECPNCLYASKHFQKLLRHTKMVHGGTAEASTTAAAERPRVATRKRSLEEDNNSGDEFADVKDVDDDKPVVHKCSMCAYVAKSAAQLGKHEREEHIKTKFFRCTKCTYVTHMKARFTKHVKYHSMPMIKCDMCDFRTPYKWNLDRHCKNHNGRGTFRCSACNFTADIKQSLTVHEMNHHVPPVGQAAGLGVGRRRNKVGASDSTAAEDGIQVPVAEQDYVELVPRNAAQKTNASGSAKVAVIASNGGNKNGKAETDFVHPDDIVHHSNGKVYIKNKCRFCTFKTAWESEMACHEQQAHSDLMLTPPKKKVTRPMPGLLPINVSPKEKRPETSVMSQTDMEKILAGSGNSDLKDFAKLFGGGDDMFSLGGMGHSTTSPQPSSFFDKFKVNMDAESLTCEHCGHESKYLTEHTTHKKSCGKVPVPTHSITSMHKLTSTRCQYCRQRCKSSKDLFNHLQTCEEAQKASIKQEDIDVSEPECSLENNNDKKPHPMENKVFIWNNPALDDNDSTNPYESFVESHSHDQDQMSIDLSIRAQSPTSESSGSLINNNVYEKPPTTEKYYQPPMTTSTPATTTTTDKIPTHGNDISVAQHKRVFKCPHCTFWASTASRFHVHIVGHLNKKPFECSLCAYRSNWRWDITKHIKLKSVRDPAHENAKVLMTDETGRRNYTKYNKYLTEIPLKGGQEETSGGMGTRPRERKTASERNTALRPPPQLKPANEYLSKVPSNDKKKSSSGDGKKTYWQCKKCNFRDLCKDKCLHHVRGHVQGLSNSGDDKMVLTNDSLSPLMGSSRTSGTWRGSELDSERHCRLKHQGDVKVLMGSASNLDESFEQMDIVQDGALKCGHCPFSSNDTGLYHMHLEGHIPQSTATIKCFYCNYYVAQAEDLQEHLKLHGAGKTNHGILPKEDKPQVGHEAEQASKRYKCVTCPYVTNSKSQFTYHKQFHQPKNGQYSCTECSYNVSKRHLLHQHMKVHGIMISPQKQNGEVLDLEEITDEMEEVHSPSFDWQNLQEIPLVWVSKGGKFSKMYRCRYCPHVNLRKVNIMDHEKMHGSRDRSSRCGETEHRCPDCNYVCNNAGVLSSHNKVHQGLYGAVHGLVDSTKTDEEQIRELGALPNSSGIINLEEDNDFEGDDREMLFFCDKCPARFLKKNEHSIHVTFHGAGLLNRCENCSYSSQQKAYLQGHSKVHTKDYQERTKTLIETTAISLEHPQPNVIFSDYSWIVEDATSDEEEPEQENGYVYKRMNVPISGTDLFLQKSEAEANEGAYSSSMTRIGKIKEKRYKCSKCPSAFEKREQFKLHLGLHGSNQQYACASCDYAVSNQANLLQHEKKHKSIKSFEDDIEEVDASPSPPARDMDAKKQYWCSMCPYTNARRDAVDNHQKRHFKLSGLQSNFVCDDCDYSVPQMHLLRDHMKLHFLPNKMHSPDAYMAQDVTEYSIKVEDNDEHDKYRLGDEIESSSLNNNEGEKLYVNTQTGEIGESAKDSEMDTS